MFLLVIVVYDGAKTRVKVDSLLGEEFYLDVGMYQGSVPSPFPFVVVVDVVTEFSREGVLSELLYADYLALMSETTERLRNMFLKRKEASKSKEVNVCLGKINVMVSGGITKDRLSEGKVFKFGVCSLRVKAISALCVQCGRWIHGRCAAMNRVTAKVIKKFAC